jgi:hypothetical protein
MTDVGSCPWDIRVDDWQAEWRGRRLRVLVTLTNRSSVASIPEPRRLRPTLRDAHNHALAVSDLYRADNGGLTVFRPVLQPEAAARIRLQFDRLPQDRPPSFLTFGEACGWFLPVVLTIPERTLDGRSATQIGQLRM